MSSSGEVDLDCILYTADLSTLPVDALRQTLKKLKAATAKLPTRPEPTIIETVEDIEFACFREKADFENYCKFDVQESLEQLLSGKTGKAVAQTYREEAERDEGSTSKASSSSLGSSVFRRKRKSTQAAVPFKEQFTYSMDFLDDEHFGERYVDVDEYDEVCVKLYCIVDSSNNYLSFASPLCRNMIPATEHLVVSTLDEHPRRRIRRTTDPKNGWTTTATSGHCSSSNRSERPARFCNDANKSFRPVNDEYRCKSQLEVASKMLMRRMRTW